MARDPMDQPATVLVPRGQFDDIARSLALEARGEIEDARGFPILDRDRFDELMARLVVGFSEVMQDAYAQSLRPEGASRWHRGSMADGEAQAA